MTEKVPKLGGLALVLLFSVRAIHAEGEQKLNVIEPPKCPMHVGEVVAVEGRLAKITRTSSAELHLELEGSGFGTALEIIRPATASPTLDDMNQLGKTYLIVGRIVMHGSAPLIIATKQTYYGHVARR